MGPSPATVGILAEPTLHEWQVRAIERLRARCDVDVPLVVANAATSDRERNATTWAPIDRAAVGQLLEDVRRERAWMLVLADRTVARLLGDDHPLWHSRPLEDVAVLADAEHVTCEPLTDDGWNELPDDVVADLADRCDVVVRFGFGLLRGDVLTAPEHGVLSFHPADIREYRGMGPPAIFHDGQRRAGSTLQRLDESIDGGEIVAYREVTLADCATLWDVFDRLAAIQITLLADGVATLRDPDVEPRTVPDERLGTFRYRDERRTLSFAGRVLGKTLAGRVRRTLRRRVHGTSRA